MVNFSDIVNWMRDNYYLISFCVVIIYTPYLIWKHTSKDKPKKRYLSKPSNGLSIWQILFFVWLFSPKTDDNSTNNYGGNLNDCDRNCDNNYEVDSSFWDYDYDTADDFFDE